MTRIARIAAFILTLICLAGTVVCFSKVTDPQITSYWFAGLFTGCIALGSWDWIFKPKL